MLFVFRESKCFGNIYFKALAKAQKRRNNVYHHQEEPAEIKIKENSIAAAAPMLQPPCCPPYLFSHAQLTPSLCHLPTERT